MPQVMHKRKPNVGMSLSASDVNAMPILITSPVPKLSWITVTPSLSRKWLDAHNSNNRPVRANHVARLAADMKAGNWRGQNGEAIRFDVNGRLADGQHRLYACIQADTPFDTLVVENVNPMDYSTIGVGAPKCYADFLGPMSGEKNVKLLASLTKMVYMWQRGHLNNNLKNGLLFPTISELDATLIAHPGMRESCIKAVGMGKSTSRMITPTQAAFIHYVGTVSGHPATVEMFLERLGNGLGLEASDPVYHLRKFLLSQKTTTAGHRRASSLYTLALLIKAWNASKNNMKLNQLRIHPNEDFPALDMK